MAHQAERAEGVGSQNEEPNHRWPGSPDKKIRKNNNILIILEEKINRNGLKTKQEKKFRINLCQFTANL